MSRGLAVAMNKTILPAAFLLAGWLHAAEFHVAPAGADAAAGTAAQPFASLERARLAVREWRKANVGAKEEITVWLEDGVYLRTQTFELTEADGGTEFRAKHDGKAVLDAGRRVAAAEFRAVTDAALLARLAPEARGQVVQLDLAKLGVQHAKRPPDIFDDGGGLPDLYCNGERQTLSRWPNDAKTTMARVLDRGDLKKAPGARGGSFVYREDRPARWAAALKADQLWLAGFWRVPWDWQTVRVQAADFAANSITLSQPVGGGIGSKYAGPEGAGTEPWIAFNLLEEIDQPGEWSVDFAMHTLFYWPPVPLAKAEVVIADFAEPMVRLKGAAHVTLRGLVLQNGLGDGVAIEGGEACAIAACTLRDLGRTGVVVRGGTKHAILSCDLHTLGHGGILLGGGDRATLTPAGHIADNNHIRHYGLTKKVYAPGIGVGAFAAGAAVGCTVTHNRIHDAPHGAVLYGGNDHLFEFNEIYDYLKESDDLGGFYSTHDWTSYGNVVRHNFIHDAPQAIGVYLDDGDSGDLLEGNLALRLAAGVSSGGGHDNVVRNNVAIECQRGVVIDARGVARKYEEDAALLKGLAAVQPAQPPWSVRFPMLTGLLENHPELPQRCVIERNVLVGAGKVCDLHGRPEHFKVVTVRDNVEVPLEEMGFIDAAKLDFRMYPDGLVLKKVPGFHPIPFEKIGLYVNDLRPVLPPRNPVESRAQK